jgi:hypothetical protein
MSYSISRYNGTLIKTVADGTIDTSLDIKLIGKSYAGYGQAQNENFVYLLENFSNTTSPPHPLSGQIWYDSANKKIKFWDASKWRTAGGAEYGPVKPTGLTTGDFWFDTTNKQLWAFNGADFTLVGPQGAAGSHTTEMQTVTVTEKSTGTPHSIIQAVSNGQVVFTISSDPAFQLDATQSPITGFDWIYQGMTLVYTNDSNRLGVTTDAYNKFWGTASNADKLGGYDVTNFVQSSSATFGQIVHFADSGYYVGPTPVEKLRVWNEGSSIPTFKSIQNNIPLVFKTTNASSAECTPLKLLNNDVLPGADSTSNLGSNSLKWSNIYANYVYSVAQKSDTLNVNGLYVSSSIANVTTAPTIVARDATGTINVSYMNGVASKSDKVLINDGSYVSATTLGNVPSTVVVRDNSNNIYCNTLFGTSTQSNTVQVNSGSYFAANTILPVITDKTSIVARDASGNFTANTVTANLTGNSFGVHKGDVKAGDNTTLIDAATKTFYGTVSASSSTRILAGNGSPTNPSIAFLSDGAIDTGLYWDTDGYIKFSNNGVYSAQLAPGGNLTVVGDMYATIFHGTATAANYADLAEKYLADAEYEVGTVMMVGGEKEITASKWGKRAIGAVSANPAYLMNKDLEGGTTVALKGRVPVKVIGSIKKGDELIAADNGCASMSVPHASGVFAIALESNSDNGVKLVECVIL